MRFEIGVVLRLDQTDYTYVDSATSLKQLCDELRSESQIGLDTEFVSEDCHEPDLCLVQLATKRGLYLIDPKATGDVRPLWDVLTSGDVEVIVHSGREEFRFAQRATGRRLNRLFDIQIAAAFVGLEYPAAYSTLVTRLADETLEKGETRTNWRTRPLSPGQLKYALQDVIHLLEMKETLERQLHEQQREAWFAEEMQSWQSEVESSDGDDRWRRISGAASLSRRGLEILKALWLWRDGIARERNRPARRVLRDDLIVELAKRETSDLRRIRSIRGLERSELKRHLPELAELIKQAMQVPNDDLPHRFASRGNAPQFRLLGQFLVAAAGCYCRDQHIAASLVGSAQDYREYAGYHLKMIEFRGNEVPKLEAGWRKDFIAPMLDDLLAGKLAMRIADPRDDQPLCLESLGKAKP